MTILKPTCACCWARPEHFCGELRFCEYRWRLFLYRERRDEHLRKKAA